jgi:hypothetical protein
MSINWAEIETKSQFHQPICATYKVASVKVNGAKDVVLFYQLLHRNFIAYFRLLLLHWASYFGAILLNAGAIKIARNLFAQKLLWLGAKMLVKLISRQMRHFETLFECWDWDSFLSRDLWIVYIGAISWAISH